MNAIKFIFVFSALLIVQTHCSLGDDDNDDDNEIIVVSTGAQKIIETAVSVITDFSVYLINGFNAGITTIEEQVNGIQKSLIDNLWNIIVKNLDSMGTDVSDFAKAPIQCIKDHGDDIKTMVYEFSSQSIICESQKTLTTLNTFLPMIGAIQTSNEEMKNLTRELDNCVKDNESVENAEACIDKVSDEITDELAGLAGTLKNEIDRASKLIENFKKLASLCHQDVESKLQTDAKALWTVLSECIEQNTINNTSS